MNLNQLLTELSERGVKLWAEGDQLRIRAPKGALTLELRDSLTQCKTELLTLLQQRHTTKQAASLPLVPIPRNGDELPLSFAQQRLWFLSQMESQNVAYNIPFALNVTGPLHIAVMERCLNEILRRHETLRTTFPIIDGSPVQKVGPPQHIRLDIMNLSLLSNDDQTQDVQRIALEEAQRPFDLVAGPLIRTTLLKLGEASHVFLLTLHHLISDWWSIEVFIREAAILYAAFSKGAASPLPELPVQYADFAYWQRKWLTEDILQQQLAYWKQQLAGELPLLALPTARPRPNRPTLQGAAHSFTLSQALSESLKTFSRQEGVTLFMTFFAAFTTLLYRYTSQEDILVGSPIANRNRLEVEPLIGLFVNTLVLRSDLSGNPEFRDLLHRVRQTTLDAYRHQDLPFEKLVEELQPERNLSAPPVFQVMFVLQQTTTERPEHPDLRITPLELETVTAMFDLTFFVVEAPQGLIGRVDYATDLFDAATIVRMIEHFRTLLESIVTFPEQRISELNILTTSERRQILVEWNDTATDYPKDTCLHKLFEEQTARTPDTVAVVFPSKALRQGSGQDLGQRKDQQLTYLELNARANQLAYYLRTMGVGPEVLVGICVERSLDMIVGLLGILKAGGAYVPLDPEYPNERLAFMLEDAETRVLLTQKGLVAGLPENQAQVVCLDTDWGIISQEPEDNPVSGVRSENPAYIIYTSGSTGRPKGIMISHRAICNHMFWMQMSFPLTKDDHVLQKTPFSFDASIWEFYAPLLVGAQLIMAQPGGHLDSAYLVKVITEQQVTILQLVPSLLHMLLERGDIETCTCLKRLFCGGEELTVALREHFFVHHNADLINLYGPSEATIDTLFFTCRKEDHTVIVPIGRPIANTQIYILDRVLQPIPVGVPGELYIGGAGLARGYLNRPELTREKFISDPFSNEPGARLYRTGDRARYLSDGNIEFLGRIDYQVKIRGFRIELGEIEALLSRHPAVRESVVLSKQVHPDDKRLVAYIVPKQEQEAMPRELRRFLKEYLPDYMIPAVFVMLDALPLLPNGKIDRRALPVSDLSGSVLREEYVAPRTPTETMLVEIWADLLECEKVGIYDNFFDLGGHSLLAVRLITKMQEQFGKNFSLAILFQAPTVAELALFIDHQQLSDSFTPLVSLQPLGENLPIFAIHPGNGQVFCYIELAKQLGIHQPFYSLQAFGLDASTSPLTSIKEMAASYIEAICSIRARGPYLLGGFSIGGVIAYEIAQQLQHQGEQVALLFLIDTLAPHLYRPPEDDIQYFMLFSYELGQLFNKDLLSFYREFRDIAPGDDFEQLRQDLERLSQDERLQYLSEFAQRAGSPFSDISTEYFDRVFSLYKANLQATLNYKAEPYIVSFLLFRAFDGVGKQMNIDDSMLGWEQYASSPIEVHDIPGDHYSILKQPHVKVLAERLNTGLTTFE